MGSKEAISNEYDCQNECQSYDGCSYWTYNSVTLMCWMKSSDSGSVLLNGAISGPKYCPGKLLFC